VGDLKRPKRAIPARPRSRLRRSAPAGRWLGRLMAAVLQYGHGGGDYSVLRYSLAPHWLHPCILAQSRGIHAGIPRNTAQYLAMARIPRSARPRPSAQDIQRLLPGGVAALRRPSVVSPCVSASLSLSLSPSPPSSPLPLLFFLSGPASPHRINSFIFSPSSFVARVSLLVAPRLLLDHPPRRPALPSASPPSGHVGCPSLLCLSRPPLLARVSNTYICPLSRGIWSAWAGVCVSLSLPRPR
jgi:hypothetical protein